MRGLKCIRSVHKFKLFVYLVGWFSTSCSFTSPRCLPWRPIRRVGWFSTSSSHLSYIADGSQDWSLTILPAASQETERGDHDICLNRSHYTDTDRTNRERATTARIEPRTSSPGVARSTDLSLSTNWSSCRGYKKYGKVAKYCNIIDIQIII